ncbi:MAG: hypothetical protein FOGNACKC_05583 [Anaerolineae bacterium]|nr:hypothetical protein [Anaerolineae bacterium]
MPKVSFAVSKTINAPSSKIYPVLANYRDHHPNILPKAYFASLVVEEGGVGQNTVFKASIKVMGAEQFFRMRVAEPEPGRVLTETDVETGLLTTFTVEPRGAEQADVTIATEFQPRPGLQGLIERLFSAVFLRRVYRVELQQLDDYMQQNKMSGS